MRRKFAETKTINGFQQVFFFTKEEKKSEFVLNHMYSDTHKYNPGIS